MNNYPRKFLKTLSSAHKMFICELFLFINQLPSRAALLDGLKYCSLLCNSMKYTSKLYEN